jgi:hypothetical protein
MKGGWRNMRHWTLCLLSLLVTQTAIANHIDALMEERGYSHASSLGGERQVHQLIRLFEQAVRQGNYELLAATLSPDPNSVWAESLSPEMRERFEKVLSAVGEETDLRSDFVPGWPVTAFRNFRLRIDSLQLDKVSGAAYLSPGWVKLRGMQEMPERFALSLANNGGRWSIADETQALALVESFVAGDALLNGPPEVWSQAGAAIVGSGSRSSLDSDSALMRRNWLEEPEVPEVNRWFSVNELTQGYDLFNCISGVTAYVHFDAEDFAHDLLAASDECRRGLVVLDDAQLFLTAMGYSGTGATKQEFRTPLGLELFYTGYLYIAEDYNNRLKVLLITSSGDHLSLVKFVNRAEFNKPADLDVKDSSGVCVVVANRGGNNIVAFGDGGDCPTRIHNGVGSAVGAFSSPTAIAFGRDPLTGEKNDRAYFIDFGNKRIVRIFNVWESGSSHSAYEHFPDPNTYLSGLAVDNQGQVWICDKGLAKIYKFSSDLQLVAIHGAPGYGQSHYRGPTAIAVAQASHQTSGIIGDFGEICLAEEWTDLSGIKRLVPGTNIVRVVAYVLPRLADGTPARICGSYYVTGYSDIVEVLTGPGGLVATDAGNNYPPGPLSFSYALPIHYGSGDYQIEVSATSIYDHSNSEIVTASVYVDSSIINQQPAVSNLYFTEPESCFVEGIPVELAVSVTDEDSASVSYHWACDRSCAGYFDNAHVNPATFTYTGCKGGQPDSGSAIPDIISVTVTDNYGQWSANHDLVIDGLVKLSWADCLIGCRVGDFDGNGSINVSDVNLLIDFVYGEGYPPQPMTRGDIDCNGLVNSSDVVALIQFVFGQGAPPGSCCNCATNWCE